MLPSCCLYAQLEGDEAQASVVSLASEQLAAQASRHAALKDAYKSAGLGKMPKLKYNLATPGHIIAAAASISVAHALVAFMRGPSYLSGLDVTNWTEAGIKTIIAKGAQGWQLLH